LKPKINIHSIDTLNVVQPWVEQDIIGVPFA